MGGPNLDPRRGQYWRRLRWKDFLVAFAQIQNKGKELVKKVVKQELGEENGFKSK